MRRALRYRGTKDEAFRNGEIVEESGHDADSACQVGAEMDTILQGQGDNVGEAWADKLVICALKARLTQFQPCRCCCSW